MECLDATQDLGIRIGLVFRDGVHELENGGEHVFHALGEVGCLGGFFLHHLCLCFDAFCVRLLTAGDAVADRLEELREAADELACSPKVLQDCWEC